MHLYKIIGWNDLTPNENSKIMLMNIFSKKLIKKSMKDIFQNREAFIYFNEKGLSAVLTELINQHAITDYNVTINNQKKDQYSIPSIKLEKDKQSSFEISLVELAESEAIIANLNSSTAFALGVMYGEYQYLEEQKSLSVLKANQATTLVQS